MFLGAQLFLFDAHAGIQVALVVFVPIRLQGRLAGLGEARDGLADAGDLEGEVALRQFAERAGAVAEQAVGELRAAGLGRTQR